MNPPNLNNNAEVLRSALQAAKTAFCATGDIPISQNGPIKLFFQGHVDEHRGRNDAKAITFPLSSSDDVNLLLDASKQASFGRGGEEVLDPSYRKALVLHAPSFAVAPAPAIDPCGLGILSKIRQTLLTGASPSTSDEFEKGRAKERRISARLDKLNVYGEGDFFKGHVDTPQSTQMFGTLLINLPVAHEGGELVVYSPRHHSNDSEDSEGGGNVTLSSNAGSYTTSWGAENVLSWIAFFSDCPHEVLPVKSGNRVTLSYNLYFEDGDDASASTVDAAQERIVEQIVHALKLPGNFDDSQPFVAFYLQHRYPVRLHEDVAGVVEAFLKGGDALIYRALRAVNARITFHYFYNGEDPETGEEMDFVFAESSQVDQWQYDCIETPLQYEFHGRTLDKLGVYTALEAPIAEYKGSRGEEREREWDEPVFATATKVEYLTYGNEATIATTYASICMIASAPGHNIKSKWFTNDENVDEDDEE